jgi:hypothetical protein
MYRDVPESNLVQTLREGGLSIGSADRRALAIEALRRAVIRGSLGVFVWHSGTSAPVKLSDTALTRLHILDRRTFFLRTATFERQTLSMACWANLLGAFRLRDVFSKSTHFAFGWTGGRGGCARR